MVYTETKNLNGKKYYYRVISVRKGNKVCKKREYLGSNLKKAELLEKEKTADEKLLADKKNAQNKEIEKIKSTIARILKKHKVTRAGIFGSYARGEQKKNSDVDILVKIEDEKMSLLGFIRLKMLLEELLKRKVDLVEYNVIKPMIKEQVLREEVRII